MRMLAEVTMGKRRRAQMRAEVAAPTPEQFRHSPIVRIETMTPGVYAHQDLGECLLDRMLHDGRLGKDDDAKRRHEAGMWLRQLFHKAQISAVVVSARAYTGVGRDGGEDLPEHVAWNRKVWNDTMRELPRVAKILERLCCYDEPVSPIVAKNALDALADYRGM